MTLLQNIQRRLDEQATMMQQQAEMIENFQHQQQVKLVDLELEEPEDDGLNMNPGNFGDGGNNHEGNGAENPPIGVPRGI